ncbi:MAG TPA: diiron oxygenase [Mycobacteriales bacterium]|nr:diiron oxygenase [Mycobacteriales bacterium]
MTETALALPPRELTASRLLTASAQHSFDPATEVDWDAPLQPGLWFLPEKRVSLYGTPLWEQMSPEQRIELSKHEIASAASVGIWFEVILMGLLARHIYDEDLTSRHVHYAFTEIADECRHSTMFGRMVERLGVPAYGVGHRLHRLSRLMFHLPLGPAIWAGILVAEEILDTFQREAMADETVQPLVRTVNRIHVVEEARHVRYAREELRREVARVSPLRLRVERMRLGLIAYHVGTHIINPGVYAAVGLDVEEARRQAAASAHRGRTMQWSAARLVSFLRDADMIDPVSERLWRKARLVP